MRRRRCTNSSSTACLQRAPSPGSYSYRTLDFVRNLTTDEAELSNIYPNCNLGFRIEDPEETFGQNEVSFEYLLDLQNLGLISGVEAPGLSVTIKSAEKDRFFRLLCSHGRALTANHDDPSKELKLGVYTLTELGKQVLSLGKFQPNEQYLRAVGEELKRQGMTVTIGSYQPLSEKQVRFFDEQPLYGSFTTPLLPITCRADFSQNTRFLAGSDRK